MMTKHRWFALLLVLGLIVAACGGDGAGDTTTTTAAPAGDGDTTTTAPPSDDDDMDDGDDMVEIATDVGVDLEAGTITVGLLSDLTGPFGPLVSAIVTGHEVYWAAVNAAGGIHGLQVNLEVVDTQYVVDNHVQFYEELKDDVVAFGHSTGSPHTVAITPQLQADDILAVPLTWYSGWSDPAFNSHLVPHGTPYCIEAMNGIEYLVNVLADQGVENPTIALASLPGDYGQDSAAGAKLAAEALGLDIVYDGEGQIIPTDESTLTVVANGIVNSGADIAYVTTTPGTFSAIYGQAIAQGYEALWSGASPSWNPAFVAPDSAIKDLIARDMYITTYVQPWFADTPGNQELRDLFAEHRPDAPPFDFYAEGFVEAKILHEALLRAYENGDMTQSGMVAAAKSLEEVNFNGLAPNETYVGTPNERLQRTQIVARPDPEGLAAGESNGTVVIEEAYVSDTAANFVFESACYSLGG